MVWCIRSELLVFLPIWIPSLHCGALLAPQRDPNPSSKSYLRECMDAYSSFIAASISACCSISAQCYLDFNRIESVCNKMWFVLKKNVCVIYVTSKIIKMIDPLFTAFIDQAIHNHQADHCTVWLLS